MRTRNVQPNNRLRALLVEFGVTHEELGEILGRSHTYISPRMTGKKAWTLDDVYAIRAFVNSFVDSEDPELIPLTAIHEFFPPRSNIAS